MLTLQQTLDLLAKNIGANQDGAQLINEVCERYLNSCDPPGSLELVLITVTADADGQGFIELPPRYQAIRGAVEKQKAASLCAWPLKIQNGWYEYAPGNLGMIKGSDGMRGIIPIPKSEGDTLTKYKVPVCPTPGQQSFFTCICKRAFLMLEDDNDVLPVQNLGAIKLGIKALAREDASDFVRGNQLWAQGKTLIAEQKDNETGPEAYGKIQMDDDFCVGDLGGYGQYGEGYGIYGRF